ncbi:MAG TPA: hypothetical protein VGL59_08510, partial [Polyangia bacterium]
APVAAREAARGVVARRPIEVGVVADAHLLSSRDLALGGGARSAIGIGGRFFLRIDALAHHAELARDAGTIALTLASVSGAVGVSFGAAWLQPKVSLGVRGGYAWMNGIAASVASTGHSENGAWFGPELAVDLSAWPRARVHPLLSLAAGAHVLGVKGTVNGGNDVTATGFWGAFSLGIAVR